MLPRRYDIADLDRVGSESQDATAMHESRRWVSRGQMQWDRLCAWATLSVNASTTCRGGWAGAWATLESCLLLRCRGFVCWLSSRWPIGLHLSKHLSLLDYGPVALFPRRYIDVLID